MVSRSYSKDNVKCDNNYLYVPIYLIAHTTMGLSDCQNDTSSETTTFIRNNSLNRSATECSENINNNNRLSTGSSDKQSKRTFKTVEEVQMDQEKNRTNSFQDWPYSHLVTPETLVEAGLYYVGPDDTVRCFSCKTKIHKWEQGNKPLHEHLKVAPRCVYATQLAKQIVSILHHNIIS